jgi:hypothetical protein
VQALPSSSAGGVPALQDPKSLHVSFPLQTLLSAQEVPAATGVCVTPLTGSQASAVQGLLSSRFGMVPGMHVPVALQVPAPVQMFPSEQVVPAATGV